MKTQCLLALTARRSLYGLLESEQNCMRHWQRVVGINELKHIFQALSDSGKLLTLWKPVYITPVHSLRVEIN